MTDTSDPTRPQAGPNPDLHSGPHSGPQGAGTPAAGAPTQEAPARRSTLRRVLLVLGSIVLAMLLVAGISRLVYSLTYDDNSGTFTITETFTEVDVGSSAADVEVSYGGVDEPELRFSAGDSQLRLRHEVSGGELNIIVDRPGWFGFGWFGFGWGWGEGATLELVLPDGMEGLSLDVDSTAGDVVVAGEFDELDVESTAGDIRLSGAATELTLDTTAGDIRVSDYQLSGPFRSDTTAGDATLDFRTLPSSIELSSTAGDVRVTLPRGEYRIETDTTAGRVNQEVSSLRDAERLYRFETTAGDIDLFER